MDCGSWNIIVDIIMIIGVFIAIKTFKDDHRRSRKEKSIDLIMKWSESLDKRTSLAKKYVEQLSPLQAKHLFDHEILEFDANNSYERKLYHNIKSLICEESTKKVPICSKCGKKKKIRTLVLTQHECSELRWLVINYLNILESILIAWQHNSANNKIIEDEFEYMFDIANGKNLLENIRIAAGREKCYPAIETFYNHIEDKRKKKLKRMRKTGQIFRL